MQQNSSSQSPIGGSRVTRIPPVGGAQSSASQNNTGTLNLNVRDNLNKSQNVVMPSGVNAYQQNQQLLQSSSRQTKKTSLSFLRKSNITTTGGGTYNQQSSTPQKNSLNLGGSKRINMISGVQAQPGRLAGLNQSKSQPGFVKIRANQINGSGGAGGTAQADQASQGNNNSSIKQQDSNQSSRKHQYSNLENKNPAKSLNATINLEQMLNGSRSNRMIPSQVQRNSLNAANGSNQGSQRNSQQSHPVGSFIAGDVDPVQISSLLADTSTGISPAKAAPINASAVNVNNVSGGNYQLTGNTPLKGRRKQPQQSPGSQQLIQGSGDQQPLLHQNSNIFAEGTTATTQSALQSFIENSQQTRGQIHSGRNPSGQFPLPQTGSISSDLAVQVNGRGSGPDISDNTSAVQSVSEHDDMASLTSKYKILRVENHKLRNLCRQNEAIITQNIDQLKQEKHMSVRLCQAILPLIKRFTKPDESAENLDGGVAEERQTLLHEAPKTAEELISLLEKIQKDVQATDFFKKIFEQDPIASENKFLTETMQALQVRLQEGEQRFELMQRLNNNLVDELSGALSELDALKRTVISSHKHVIPVTGDKNDPTAAEMKTTEDDDMGLVVPSFLRVMQAEQVLVDNFVYEDSDEMITASNLLQMRLLQPLGVRRLDESSEAEVENENSIPQESSIAANVSFQNQRRATGTLNAQNQRINGAVGMTRGKSTPVMQSAKSQADSSSAAVQQQQQKGNSSNLDNKHHPTMVGASVVKIYGQALKARSAVKSNKNLPPLRGKDNPVIPSQQRRLPPVNSPLFRPLAVGDSTQSQQQPHPLVISNASGASSSLSGGFNRFNQSQRIMTHELRGLGGGTGTSSAIPGNAGGPVRARNSVQNKHQGGGSSKTQRTPVMKYQNYVADSRLVKVSPAPVNTTPKQKDSATAQGPAEETKSSAEVKKAAPQRSFSPVVLVKKYLNIK